MKISKKKDSCSLVDIKSSDWYMVTLEKKMRCSVRHPTLYAKAEQSLLPPTEPF
jgi:hypothetical protein